MMHRTGLTLGKFAPFHHGHQFLIATALKEVGHLIVIVYQAKRTTRIPLPLRAGWIRSLYPQAEVVEAPDAPEGTGHSPEIRALHEEFLRGFLRDTLRGRTVDAFYSSEPYGAWASEIIGCANRTVDPERRAVPVSGTKLREDAAQYRAYIHPMVRADLVSRIVLLGGPRAERERIARELEARLGELPPSPQAGRGAPPDSGKTQLNGEEPEGRAARLAEAEKSRALEAEEFLVVVGGVLEAWLEEKARAGKVSAAFEAILADYLVLPRGYWLCGAESETSAYADALSARGIPFRIAAGSPEAAVETMLDIEDPERERSGGSAGN